MESQNHSIVGITEMYWDSLNNWRKQRDGCKIFRKHRQGRQGGGVALCVKEQLGCVVFSYGMNAWLVESLWVRNRGEDHKGDIVVSLPDQAEEVDSDLFKQLKDVSGHRPRFSWGT